MVRVCFLIPFHLERVELVLVLRSLDRKVQVVVVEVVRVDLADSVRLVDYHYCRCLHFLVHLLHLLRVVVLGRVEMGKLVRTGMSVFVFLYLVGDNGSAIDCLFRQGVKLGPRELVKKD